MENKNETYEKYRASEEPPHISIIIPTYNAQNTIRETIESIDNSAANISESIELIIADDASNDKTKEVVKEIMENSNRAMKLITTDKNRGPGIARNRALEKACGKYILFVDADDLITEKGLMYLINIVRDKEVDLMSYNYIVKGVKPLEDNEGIKKRRRDAIYIDNSKKELVKAYLEMKMDGSAIFTLFRRKFLEEKKLKFREGLHEDIDFMFKAYLYSKWRIYIPDVVYIKRNKSGSIINTFSKKHCTGYMKAWEKIYETINRREMELTETKINPIKHYKIGLRGAIGVIISQTRRCLNKDEEASMIEHIVNIIKENKNLYADMITQNPGDFTTKYDMIYAKVHEKLCRN